MNNNEWYEYCGIIGHGSLTFDMCNWMDMTIGSDDKLYQDKYYY